MIDRAKRRKRCCSRARETRNIRIFKIDRSDAARIHIVYLWMLVQRWLYDIWTFIHDTEIHTAARWLANGKYFQLRYGAIANIGIENLNAKGFHRALYQTNRFIVSIEQLCARLNGRSGRGRRIKTQPPQLYVYRCNSFITRVESGYINYRLLSASTFCSHLLASGVDVTSAAMWSHSCQVECKRHERVEKGAFLKRRLHSAGWVKLMCFRAAGIRRYMYTTSTIFGEKVAFCDFTGALLCKSALFIVTRDDTRVHAVV